MDTFTNNGDTANMKAVPVEKLDNIFDVGTVNQIYASLSDKLHKQTNIPYVLINGTFVYIAESLSKISELLGKEAQVEKFTAYI